ncbi:MAG: prepilin-type N-terminal cleavage/methylation domain-containing protein [Planctomycetes bacterium]|nr:prepilin-type N-terminal cleavage/methylation domain-containing protein [Planctomycetota bacterium]
MLPSRRNLRRIQDRQTQVCRITGKLRAGFTLVEMVFSMTILAFSATIFGGLMLAINSAWDHSTAIEDSRRQAQSALSRIKWMAQQSGTYRLAGSSTVLGIGIVSTSWSTYQAPTTLVIWSGGANGGMNAVGTQSRLPVASELVIYAPDSTNPARFVEVTFPGNSTAVDFRASTFSTTIQSLISSSSRQAVLLSDHLATVASLQGFAGASLSVGNARFELTTTPTDSQISAVTVGSQEWNDLPWGQGLVGADRALRTTNLRIELNLVPDPKSLTTDNGYSTAVPYFGSVNRQYVYQP